MTRPLLQHGIRQSGDIRLFLGTATIGGPGEETLAAIYTPCIMDHVFASFPGKLTPCGKVRLLWDLAVQDNTGTIHEGVVAVPADKAEAILDGCSMQRGFIDEETTAAQRVEYQKGLDRLQALRR